MEYTTAMHDTSAPVKNTFIHFDVSPTVSSAKTRFRSCPPYLHSKVSMDELKAAAPCPSTSDSSFSSGSCNGVHSDDEMSQASCVSTSLPGEVKHDQCTDHVPLSSCSTLDPDVHASLPLDAGWDESSEESRHTDEPCADAREGPTVMRSLRDLEAAFKPRSDKNHNSQNGFYGDNSVKSYDYGGAEQPPRRRRWTQAKH